MTATLTFMLMLLAHLVADYTLQGWLADGKQKKWWQKCFGGGVPPKYSHDYVTALVCHALYWSLIVCLPLVTVGHGAYVINALIQGALHCYVDDKKANKMTLNLVEDQIVHAIQIISIWGAWMVAR